jgi:hypothetical protein
LIIACVRDAASAALGCALRLMRHSTADPRLAGGTLRQRGARRSDGRGRGAAQALPHAAAGAERPEAVRRRASRMPNSVAGELRKASFV